MAIKGLSKPIFGKYVNTAGVITYTDGVACGHAVSYTFDPTVSDDNPLYGDNMIAENDVGSFQSGTLTLGTTEMPDDVSKFLLGLKEETITVGQDSVKQYVYDDDAAPQVVGVGLIEMHQVDDVTYYKGIILPKCRPRFRSHTAETKGETITWQTPEIEFGVERSDEAKHRWFIESELKASEEDVFNYLKSQLGVAAG